MGASQRQEVRDLWMAGWTEREIVEKVGVPKTTVHDWLAEMVGSDKSDDSDHFRKLDFSPKLYAIWDFPKLTNAVTVFGSVPQEIVMSRKGISIEKQRREAERRKKREAKSDRRKADRLRGGRRVDFGGGGGRIAELVEA